VKSNVGVGGPELVWLEAQIPDSRRNKHRLGKSFTKNQIYYQKVFCSYEGQASDVWLLQNPANQPEKHTKK